MSDLNTWEKELAEREFASIRDHVRARHVTGWPAFFLFVWSATMFAIICHISRDYADRVDALGKRVTALEHPTR